VVSTPFAVCPFSGHFLRSAIADRGDDGTAVCALLAGHCAVIATMIDTVMTAAAMTVVTVTTMATMASVAPVTVAVILFR